MPLSDAVGCWQSDGAGNTSIAACGGVSLSGTNTWTGLNTFNNGLTVAMGLSGTVLKATGAFGEEVFEASVANGWRMENAFGTTVVQINRSGNVDAVSYSAGGTPGFTAACTGVALTVKAGIVTNCI
jgi:hypothetical protein